jgi:hypothetical protein
LIVVQRQSALAKAARSDNHRLARPPLLILIDAPLTQIVAPYMKAKPHPEQGFRSCLGIIRLVDSYGPQRIEAAAKRGNDIGATNLGSITRVAAFDSWRSLRGARGPRLLTTGTGYAAVAAN